MAKRSKYDWNKKAIIQAIGRVNTEFLFMAGSFVRNRARGSMKKGVIQDGQRVPSAPGKSPFRWGNQLYDFMLYSFDPSTNSMVIGPKLLSGRKSGRNSTAHTLEQGGTAEISFRLPAPPRGVRKWGPKHYQGTRPKLKKRLPDGTDTYRYFRSRAAHERASQASGFLTWARQMDAGNPPVTVRVMIEPRPFMSKALRQVLSEKVMTRLYERASKKAYK